MTSVLTYVYKILSNTSDTFFAVFFVHTHSNVLCAFTIFPFRPTCSYAVHSRLREGAPYKGRPYTLAPYGNKSGLVTL